jgi:hypothetical protein
MGKEGTCRTPADYGNFGAIFKGKILNHESHYTTFIILTIDIIKLIEFSKYLLPQYLIRKGKKYKKVKTEVKKM